jgi:hypothetical protein
MTAPAGALQETRCKEKGPLECKSGPSLGRKRPRRAAIAQSTTAPQQYATALHKAQVLSNRFQRKINEAYVTATSRRFSILLHIFN